jgi:hypothetical protein
MGLKCRRTLNLALFLSSHCFAKEVAGTLGPETDESLTVHFYNYTKVSNQTLRAAQVQANSIFRAAGIMVTWVECPISEADAERVSCPQTKRTFHVDLQIVPASMAAMRHQPDGELGLATYPGAYVFYDRIREFCRTHPARETMILSHVIAHEIGHLLLGEGSHSNAGIMQPVFNPNEVMKEQRSYFTESQRKRMRGEIRRELDRLQIKE